MFHDVCYVLYCLGKRQALDICGVLRYCRVDTLSCEESKPSHMLHAKQESNLTHDNNDWLCTIHVLAPTSSSDSSDDEDEVNLYEIIAAFRRLLFL